MGFGPDIVRQARQADLGQWLRMNGVPLKKAGQWWYVEDHDSLRIQGNKWYHNSQSIGGNSIDFLVYYYQMPAKQAIIELVGAISGLGLRKEKCGVKEKNIRAHSFDFTSVETDTDYRRILAYLVKTRGITFNIVMDEIKNGHLYQEKGTANAIFAILDETGKVVGAETNGTLSYKNARYKGLKAGSLSGYGYNTGQRQNPRFILYFESAIDLLSFISLSAIRSKLLRECLLVSMAGLKPSVVVTTLHAFGSFGSTPVLCVDNDASADAFIDRCIVYPAAIIRRPLCEFKDWNDQLFAQISK